MFKVLLFLISFSTFFLSSFGLVHAAGDDDLTSSGFIIHLGDIDPVNSDATVPTGGEAATKLLAIIANLLLFAMPLVAGVSLVIAGYYYILSSGDSEKVNKAKTIIKWNAVALLVALFSYAIIYLISTLLDGAI